MLETSGVFFDMKKPVLAPDIQQRRISKCDAERFHRSCRNKPFYDKNGISCTSADGRDMPALRDNGIYPFFRDNGDAVDEFELMVLQASGVDGYGLTQIPCRLLPTTIRRCC